jgi:hypothetical protein
MLATEQQATKFISLISQVYFTLLGFGCPLLMTLFVVLVDQLQLLGVLPGVGERGSCFLTIQGAKVS